MLSLKDWMELVDYRITEGSEFQWSCYGPTAYILDSWNGIHGPRGYSFSIVFDTVSQTVFEVSVCDYTNDRAYRMINPQFRDEHSAEGERRGVAYNEVFEGVDYVDLDVAEDFIEKSQAIKLDKDYDTRIIVPLDISDEDLLKYMKFAHEKDITFNELADMAMRRAMDDIKSGKLTIEEIQKVWKEKHGNENQTGQ